MGSNSRESLEEEKIDMKSFLVPPFISSPLFCFTIAINGPNTKIRWEEIGPPIEQFCALLFVFSSSSSSSSTS